MKGYEIIHYEPELLGQVVELMKYLWDDDLSVNESHFKWKYHDNPYTKEPLVIIALHNGKVVGFRGYSATKWQVQGSEFMALSAGDTVVHSNHRRKGLSVEMGYKANDEYALKYKVIINFSAGENSLPGYMKLGFIPLFGKSNWTRKAIHGDRRRIIGQFDDILVLDEPRLQETYINPDNITLVQDEEFLRWRYKNERNNYTFYHHGQNCVVIGALVGNRHGFIVDYTEGVESFKHIMKYISKMKYFNFISISNFSLSNILTRTLRGLGFKTDNPDVEYPLMIRPVKRNYSESDWFIEELDVRMITNWKMKGICSDAA